MRHERGPEELQRLLLRVLYDDGYRPPRGHPDALRLQRSGSEQLKRHADEQSAQRSSGS